MVFGIYCNGQTIYNPQLVDPHDCEVENAELNRAIIAESHQIYDVPANMDDLLIFEIQLPFSKRLEENAGRTDSFGVYYYLVKNVLLFSGR